MSLDTLPDTPTAYSDAVGSLSPSEKASWRLTGELPKTSDAPEAEPAPADTSSPSTEAASSPAEPDVQDVSTETAPPPASEPGTPKKANAETRKAQLNAEIQALLAKKKALETDLASSTRASQVPDVRPASSPVQPETPTLAAVIRTPDLSKPILPETEFYETFQDASALDYIRYASRYEALSVHQEMRQQQTVAERRAAFSQAITTATTDHPDLLTLLPQALQYAPPVELLDGAPAGPLNYVMQEACSAESPSAVLRYLADHPETVVALQATRTPLETVRMMGQITARVQSPSVPPQSVVKTTTSAPAPPHTLGSKAAPPVDEIKAAVAAGNSRRYNELMNARESA